MTWLILVSFLGGPNVSQNHFKTRSNFRPSKYRLEMAWRWDPSGWTGSWKTAFAPGAGSGGGVRMKYVYKRWIKGVVIHVLLCWSIRQYSCCSSIGCQSVVMSTFLIETYVCSLLARWWSSIGECDLSQMAVSYRLLRIWPRTTAIKSIYVAILGNFEWI